MSICPFQLACGPVREPTLFLIYKQYWNRLGISDYEDGVFAGQEGQGAILHQGHDPQPGIALQYRIIALKKKTSTLYCSPPFWFAKYCNRVCILDYEEGADSPKKKGKKRKAKAIDGEGKPKKARKKKGKQKAVDNNGMDDTLDESTVAEVCKIIQWLFVLGTLF